jgi:hypothetical protein
MSGVMNAAVSRHSRFRPAYSLDVMKRFALALILLALPAKTFAACGARGGPGYRGPDQKCVSWANLRRVCGTPPTTNCTAEMVAESAGAIAGVRPAAAAASGTASAVGLLSATTAASAAVMGPIVGQASVVDADTIEIHGQRIRLAGIDAPESDQLCRDANSNHYRCGIPSGTIVWMMDASSAS